MQIRASRRHGHLTGGMQHCGLGQPRRRHIRRPETVILASEVVESILQDVEIFFRPETRKQYHDRGESQTLVAARRC
jgi:hypothetical protein